MKTKLKYFFTALLIPALVACQIDNISSISPVQNVVTNQSNTTIINVGKNNQKGANIVFNIEANQSFKTKATANGTAEKTSADVKSYTVYLLRTSDSTFPVGGDPLANVVNSYTITKGTNNTIIFSNVQGSGTNYYHVAIRAWSNTNGSGTELIKANNGNLTAWSGSSIGQKIAVSSSGVKVQDNDLSLSSTTPLSITTNLLDIVPSKIDTTITLTGTYSKVNSYKMALCTDPNRPVSTRIGSNPVIVNRNSSQLNANMHTVTFTNVPAGTYYATAEAYNASGAGGSNLTANDNSKDAAYTAPDNQSRVAVSTNTITVNANQTLDAITNFTIPLNMDENTHSYSFTGNANDTSGNGANGSPSNATLTNDRNGIANSAYELNGINGVINIPVPNVNIVNNFTMSIWFKPTTIHEIDPETANPVAPAVTPGTSGQRYLIYPNHGGDATGKAGVGISAGINGISIYEHAGGYMPALLVWQSPITTWTHAVLVYNNRVPSLYVNGNLVKTGVAGLRGEVSPFTTNANLVIGGLAYGNFPGSVDDFKIFNRILSAAEIIRLYQGLI